ncbi:nucleotidyltransferase family protein [Gammaproteobacteria bacterium]|jgi:MurNAc alpha-1-phosphate uridylyltransferase|nr:nucleotidyltransferase family protein [Gammaproteobacteria bacterium]MDC1099950.1 nucleotidyltransferase family protein [Gammaproteobacteria bacterium]MDC3244914.1 nucleotidyltransferase family protein [Gammaproteobacteria bacterium]|tara:strand:+ start:3271 stop:3942 length:672 start_codon:yes stop_codon:yes gene_type:complete
MKAMILAAGLGKRLKPLTNDIPKPLLKVGNQSLIERNIRSLLNYGFDEIVINVSYLGNMITEHVLEIFPNNKIIFSKESEPLGTGGGIKNALKLLGDEPFMLINADIYHNINLAAVKTAPKYAHLVGVKNPEHNIQGDFSLDNNIVLARSELNDFTWSGISIINPTIFSQLQTQEMPFDIWNSVLMQFINNNKITAEIYEGIWIDTGTIDRLELANKTHKDEN